MIKAIKQFFDQRIAAEAREDTTDEHRLQVATAAMLVEMTRADFDVTSEEIDSVAHAIQLTFGLSPSETTAIIELAEAEANQATDDFQFTALINRGFSREQKVKVIELMWQVAYADGKMDKYEDHLVRKIAGLLHVSHNDFIAAKHRARAARHTT